MSTAQQPIPQEPLVDPKTGLITPTWWRFLRDPILNSLAVGGRDFPNKLTFSGAMAGGTPSIGVSGGDNDIDLAISSAGAGNLALNPNSGDIQWGKPLVALGGGASATMGKIGGSGPSTAAQFAWMQVLDSTGILRWVPVWV